MAVCPYCQKPLAGHAVPVMTRPFGYYCRHCGRQLGTSIPRRVKIQAMLFGAGAMMLFLAGAGLYEHEPSFWRWGLLTLVAVVVCGCLWIIERQRTYHALEGLIPVFDFEAVKQNQRLLPLFMAHLGALAVFAVSLLFWGVFAKLFVYPHLRDYPLTQALPRIRPALNMMNAGMWKCMLPMLISGWAITRTQRQPRLSLVLLLAVLLLSGCLAGYDIFHGHTDFYIQKRQDGERTTRWYSCNWWWWPGPTETRPDWLTAPRSKRVSDG